MAIITQTVHLTTKTNAVPQIVRCVQNDSGREVKMILDDLTVTSGMTGEIAFLRSDGTHYAATATPNTSDSSFTAPIDQALTQAGKTFVQLKVIDTDVVSTFTFVIYVEKDTSGTVTEQEGISLTQAIQAAEDAQEAAEDAADRAEEAASTLELDATLTSATKAAQAKAVGDEIGEVKSALSRVKSINNGFSDGTPSLLVYDWTRGENWKSGNNVLTSEIAYRVCNYAPFSYPVSLTFSHTGFYVKAYIDSGHDNTYATSISWTTNPITIPANTNVYVSLKRITENTSETASIEEFVNSLKINPFLTDVVKNKIDDFTSTVETVIGYDFYPIEASIYNENHYIGINGIVYSQSNFSIYGLVSINKGETIKVTAKGYLTDVAIIAVTDANGSLYTPVVISTDSTTKEYSYTATANVYVAITSHNSVIPTYYIENDNVNERLNDLEHGIRSSSYTPISGKYVTYAGTIVESPSFSMSEPIQVYKGELVEIYAKGYNGVAMISTCLSDSSAIIAKSIASDSVARSYYYVVEENGYVLISYNSTTVHYLSIYKSSSGDAMLLRLNEIEEKTDENTSNIDVLKNKINLISSFKNLTCIGDSLTYSQVYTSASSARQAFNPYPKVMEHLTGVPATILATPGYSASDNWSAYSSDIIQKDGQLAIVYLGTNGGLTDTIDTDCVGDDYTQWANTNTGCYAKIIAKLLSVKSRVVLVKIHSGSVETTNSVIDKMGIKFSVPVINNTYLSGNKYHSYPDGTGANGTHYNDFGYTVFAQQVINSISSLSNVDLIKILPM